MSSLRDVDKRYLEKIFEMGGGYVLEYTDATFGEFFSSYKIDIHSLRYQKQGTSKAKKMRAFWKLEPDEVVAKVLSEMLKSYEAQCEIESKEIDSNILTKAKAIMARLGGKKPDVQKSVDTEEVFLTQEFKIQNLDKLPIEQQIIIIVEKRLEEARLALKARAYLCVILMCGSVLEGVLLGAAVKYPEKFNRASSTPKSRDDKPKSFHEWKLAELIDVACEVKMLKPDVKEFGHGLRGFRNYIHPYEQMKSGFAPDEHTAKVCFQVLKAALASLTGER